MPTTADASRSLVARLKAAQRLPSPPGVALRVIELCRRDDTDSRQIGLAIDADPVLTARLLRYANSPLAGIAKHVTSAEQAIRFLGFRNVQVIALGFALAPGRQLPQCPRFNLAQFWTQTIVRAAVAKRLAQALPGVDHLEVFTAGLLGGLGRLTLVSGMPQDYNQVLDAVERGADLCEAEVAQFGTHHASFGGAMLEDWRLPAMLVESVRWQVEPDAAPQDYRTAAKVCHLAGRLAPLFLADAVIEDSERENLRGMVESLTRFDEARWAEISQKVVADTQELRKILEAPGADQVCEAQLFGEAHKLATRLAMNEQMARRQMMEDQAQLLQQASSDALTGLANRAKFNAFLNETLSAARRGQRRFALIFFDLDNFKTINDTLGHPAGDRALIEVAEVVQQLLREGDLFARFGGDEFAIVAAEADRAQACRIAQRINSSVAELRIEGNGKVLPVTVSVGIATYPRPNSAIDAAGLLEAADQELYRSKRGGRNRWSCTDEAA